MSNPPLNNPNARYWDGPAEEFDFTPQETQEIREGADRMIAEVRVRRLAEVQVPERDRGGGRCGHGISRVRVSRIEKEQLEKSEVETLAACMRALGGKLKIIADFSDETYGLG
jgi:hypothetical protein